MLSDNIKKDCISYKFSYISKLLAFVVWPYCLYGLFLRYIPNVSMEIFWFFDVVFYAIIPLLTVVYLVKKGMLSKEDVGIFKKPTSTQFIVGLSLFIYFIILYMLVYPGLITQQSADPFSGYRYPKQKVLFFIVLAYASISAAFIEEIIFRSILINKLEMLLKSKFLVVILSCIIFSLIHWVEGPCKILYYFIWSLPLSIYYIYSKNIWPTIVAHFLYVLAVPFIWPEFWRIYSIFMFGPGILYIPSLY